MCTDIDSARAATAVIPGAALDIDERIKWYHSPIAREELQRLMVRSDWRGFRQMGQHLGLLLATGTLAFWVSRNLPWPWVIPAVYLHGSFYTFIGMGTAGHELCHRTVFKTKFWNEFFLWVVSFLGWSNFVAFRTSHVKHHQLTTYQGLDLEVVLPQKLNRREWLWAFTIHIPGIWRVLRTAMRYSVGRLEGDWENRIFPESNPALRRQLANVSRFVLIAHVALAALFIHYQLWILFFLVTLAPLTASWLGLLCSFPQHAGMQPNVPDFRLCCRTMILNRFVSFLYWQMNYHIEHHMYAAVPFFRLRELRRAIASDLPPASHGLLATWKDLLPILKRQRTEPDYCIIPTLPPPSRSAAR